MSRIVTPNNKLFVIFKLNDIYNYCTAYSDIQIEKICREYLDALTKGNGDYFYTAQELVWSVMRSLLYKEYKAYQSQVEFCIEENDVERLVKHNSRMRMAEHPPSVWDDALCKLVGEEDE